MSQTALPPSANNIAVRPEVALIQNNIEQVIRGKSDVIKNAIIGVLARGHVLLEDVPGVGKTTLALLLARSLNLTFSRVQFTSDMLPGDILGVMMYDAAHHSFDFRQGPIFANVVLADEINRTSPKTQSALLECMNSGSVSIDKQTFHLPQPFIVLATQNPIEFHGTFPLPKSQMDRFLLRISVGYPNVEQEIEILREQRHVGDISHIQSVCSGERILHMQNEVDDVRVDDELLRYIADIVDATRRHRAIELGVSTRGALALRRAAQSRAYYENRNFVIPDDIKTMVPHVLAHRLQLLRTFERENASITQEVQILNEILTDVAVPV